MAIVTASCVVLSLAGCFGSSKKSATTTPLPSASGKLSLTSSAFPENTPIPVRYTCDGQNQPPPLAWKGVPARAAELALMLDDPDAPGGDFTHWTLYAIPPRVTQLRPGSLPADAVSGRNSSGRNGYSGPCPPQGAGAHRYRFTLYAVAKRLQLAPGASPAQFRAAVGAAALARGTLVGSYSR